MNCVNVNTSIFEQPIEHLLTNNGNHCEKEKQDN